MAITRNPIPPATPLTMATFFERLASESEFWGFCVGGKEAALEKYVVVEVAVGIPVEMAVGNPIEPVLMVFDAPMSTPGPISGLPKNVGVKRPKTSEKKVPTTQGLRVVGVPIILELSYAVHKCWKRNRSQRTVTSMRAH